MEGGRDGTLSAHQEAAASLWGRPGRPHFLISPFWKAIPRRTLHSQLSGQRWGSTWNSVTWDEQSATEPFLSGSGNIFQFWRERIKIPSFEVLKIVRGKKIFQILVICFFLIFQLFSYGTEGLGSQKFLQTQFPKMEIPTDTVMCLIHTFPGDLSWN